VILTGKRIVVTGVATRDSIAYAVAEEAQRAGAEIVLTTFGRMRSLTERAARRLPDPVDVLELDANCDEHFEELARELDGRWGVVDGVVHSIAWAPPDALGDFIGTPPESVTAAFHTSAFSLKALAAALVPLMERSEAGAAVVGVDFDASVAWPGYDWMGVSKAALESISRYLARDLGRRRVRVNLVSAGPVKTPAASGVPGFDRLIERWGTQAPLGWDERDATPIAHTVCFLLSEWARGITGEIVHVDGGFHAMGAPLGPPAALEAE